MEEQMGIEFFDSENMQSNDFDDELMFLYDTCPAKYQKEFSEKQSETRLDSYDTSLNSVVPKWQTDMDYFEGPLNIVLPEWKPDMKLNSYATEIQNSIPKWVLKRKVASENSDQKPQEYIHPVKKDGYECQCIKCIGTSENSNSKVMINDSKILGSQCYSKNAILGQCFKLYRLNKNIMTDELRECLANCLIEMELDRVAKKNDLSSEQMLESFTISIEKFIEISSQIENTFLGENKLAFFSNISMNGDQRESPKGFLWSEYCKKVEKLKKPDIELTQHKKECAFKPPIQSNEPRKKLLDSEDIIWLHEKSEPFEDILIHWKQSYDSRRALLQDHFSPKEYFDYFPCLHTPNAVDILVLDFVIRYPKQSEAFKMRWDIIKLVIAIQLKKNTAIRDSGSKYLASCFPTFSPLEQDHLVMFFLPLFVKNRKVKRNGKNPTPIQANRTTVNSVKTRREAFYLNIENPSSLEETLLRVRKERSENSTLIHPLIILVKPLPESGDQYVLWNDMLITVPSCVDAVDLAFKIMTALNLPFPELSKETWRVIQKCGYSIDTSEPYSKSSSDFINLFRQACYISEVEYVL